MPVTFQDVLRAWPVVHRWLPRTPLYRYPLLSARWGVDAWVKHENHMPIGAFKVRGGVNLFANLSDSQRARGVITATRGNHGLSLAWAARAFGSRAVIYVPKGNNPEKNAIMSALGAEVVEFGRDFDEARMEAEARARNELLRYVHPANEPLLIAGIGTMAMEIAEDLPDADVVIVPIGGGSLLAGTIVALRTLRPDMQIIGVQAERADAMARSLESGMLTSIENADTFADGLATRFAFELPFEIAKGKVDRVVRVSEDEMKEAVRTALEGTHNAAEGAAAASYAAAFKLRGELARKKVVILHTGHNIDRNTLRWALGLFDA
ncbi:threonine dehydratase [Sandaracinus amylolyticus]|uniref:threonine dehydratase n=1 Tax=Sandaracinus amylolyticus TaxID=927083 RepID=UPI001F328A44|nr:threonine dehydratase [Sandaracinus amylolyticus]UJR81337.1 L-threonine dehydratase biosynthetic IlvA [Sandaracinus amylolyticus]